METCSMADNFSAKASSFHMSISCNYIGIANPSTIMKITPSFTEIVLNGAKQSGRI